MKCIVCNKEYEARRATSKYCSGKCRKAFQRVSGTGEVSGTEGFVPVTGKPGDTDYDGCMELVDGFWREKDRTTAMKDMTPEQLAVGSRAYPQDVWFNSPEHKELLRRLVSMSVDELKSDGYFVPCWKYKEAV